MVIGMDRFREKFQEYPDCYTVIGGAACDILMTEAEENLNLNQIGLPFDMEEGISILEKMYNVN